MKLKSSAALTLAAIVVLAAGALKIERYSSAGSIDTAQFEASLEAVLSAQGWQVAKRIEPGASGEPYRKLTFRKRDCSQVLTVAYVGTTTGLEPFLRSRYGDLAFLQGGEVVKKLAAARDQLQRLRILSTGTDTHDRHPAIAISPAPASAMTGRGCAVPPAEVWREISTWR